MAAPWKTLLPWWKSMFNVFHKICDMTKTAAPWRWHLAQWWWLLIYQVLTFVNDEPEDAFHCARSSQSPLASSSLHKVMTPASLSVASVLHWSPHTESMTVPDSCISLTVTATFDSLSISIDDELSQPDKTYTMQNSLNGTSRARNCTRHVL